MHIVFWPRSQSLIHVSVSSLAVHVHAIRKAGCEAGNGTHTHKTVACFGNVTTQLADTAVYLYIYKAGMPGQL